MARGKKKAKAIEWVAQADPRAPLDAKAFLTAAKPVLAELTEDLLARADGSKGVTRALKRRHAEERKKERTADGYAVWRRQVVEQISAAWLLSCVFVRTLEDRGLLPRNRIAGPGARDGEQMFLQLAPYLTARDYLLVVFEEMRHFEAVAGLFEKGRSLVWWLAPSAEGAGRLLELFRLGDAEAPAFRFGQGDTRFLGDLYQDLNEGVRERFALLQTPDFVEEFILDRTLEVAIEKFGVERTEVIDPTCGSGHFLLGAFGRLFERRLREAPGEDRVTAASKALGAVAGVDVNPYAVAIAGFRLTLAFLEKAGFERLEGAPRVAVNVVVADSLLYNAQLEQRSLSELEGQSASAWEAEAYALEDEVGAKRVLEKRYAAVVGNPPYITVKDKVLRGRYPKLYKSCRMNYALTVPFTERFFQLARPGGRTGMITANSFMKREFGKSLIEEYLRTVNLDTIINTSGAHIPGHSTPTVLLFGSHEAPQEKELLTVLANRGEPTIPVEPKLGLVWSSIADHWNETGFENEYISVARTARDALLRHPWTLEGGGASQLKKLIEDRAKSTLADTIKDIGFSIILGEDEIYLRPKGHAPTAHLPRQPILTGQEVRDWTVDWHEEMLRPFDPNTLEPTLPSILKATLWPYKTTLAARIVSGSTSMAAANRHWYDVRRLSRSKLQTPLSITFAEIATHNHFVLDRGGKIFKQTAPIIKLPETATEDDHLALLGYLNSSTACFWMKQVAFPKSTSTAEDLSIEKGRPEKNRYAFASNTLKPLPLPPCTANQRTTLITLARTASELAQSQQALSGRHIVDEVATNPTRDRSYLAEVESRRESLAQRLVVIQEDIDWLVYHCFGLSPSFHPSGDLTAPEDHRPFLAPSDSLPAPWRPRKAEIAKSKHLQLLEAPLYKRPWSGRRGIFGHAAKTLTEEVADAAAAWLQERAEELLRNASTPLSFHHLATQLAASDSVRRVCTELLDGPDVQGAITKILANGDAVPLLTSLYLRPTGLEKHAEWRHTWQLQRREDAGEKVGSIPVPPKYKPADFFEQREFSLRGPLDVPKERFISYPGCASDHDHSPVYGWAGWDHAQRAQALAQLYLARKTEEAWSAERLTPMLAGLDELVFWLELWHGDPHPDYGMPLSTFYADFIASECRELDLTLDDLRNWRPPKGFGKAKKASKTKASSKKTKATKKTTPAEPEPSAPESFALTSEPTSKPKRPRKPRAAKKAAT